MNEMQAGQLFEHPGMIPRTRMLVMGLGGAGCNSVARMSTGWKQGPPVIALNTDAQCLAGCEAPRIALVGPETTKGLSANGDPNVGRMAMQESLDTIKELLPDVDLLFLVVGLGGGTGGGGAPLLLQAAHQMNIMTLCFVTLPFGFESDGRKRQSEESLQKIRPHADAVITLPNERLIELVDANAGLEEVFRTADRHVAAVIHSLWRLLSARGLMNLDFADLRHLVERSRGYCYIGVGEGSGPARVPNAVKNLLASPYLNTGRSVAEAKVLMVNVTGGPDLTLADVQGMMALIQASTRADASMCIGAVIDPAMREQVTITAMVTDGGPASIAVAPEPQVNTASPKPIGKGSKRRDQNQQGELPFPDADRGTFRNLQPTTFRGEDLDIPTYVRRGINLSFEA